MQGLQGSAVFCWEWEEPERLFYRGSQNRGTKEEGTEKVPGDAEANQRTGRKIKKYGDVQNLIRIVMVSSVTKLLLVVIVCQRGKGGDRSLMTMKWLFCVYQYRSARSSAFSRK